jgi:WD40 repeat protein/uncharacterized caspase-like protein
MSPVSRGTSRSAVALETGEAKLWLLLVGVNQYRDRSLPPLSYSALDCQGLAEALAEATQSFPEKVAIAYHDFAAQIPTLATVRSSLAEIISVAKSQDTILFYFSGHGILESQSQQAFLCLADTEKDNLSNTGLSLQELLQMLDRCAARHQLVWLDACHSGGMTLKGASQKSKFVGAQGLAPVQKSEVNEQIVTSDSILSTALNTQHSTLHNSLNATPQMVQLLSKRAARSQGFYALLSCDRAQQSWEFPELGHGVFTYYLMRGLRGEAADLQGIIDADGLYKYVYHQTLQYVDKKNQQLRLINQQKRGRGDPDLSSEYPLQTPKRIVEGVGEIILGVKPETASSRYRRQALIFEGIGSNQTSLELSKFLHGAGNFEVEYLPRSGADLSQVRETIHACLHRSDEREDSTILLYFRGEIEKSTEGESWLRLGDNIRLSSSWLRQELRNSPIAQQIVVLDCLGGESLLATARLQNWLDDLQLEIDRGQCLLAAATPTSTPEKFTQAVLETLQTADEQVGLTAAAWIAQLQVKLAGTEIKLLAWLSGFKGVIEVIPDRVGEYRSTNLDLGICPYMGLRAFTEEDAHYFYGREALTQQLINQVSHQSFVGVIGASGSGKSSVVQAGLIAQLKLGKQLPESDRWWVKSFRPGIHPIESLSRRLVDANNETEKAQQQLQIEGLLYQGIEGLVYWLRSRAEPMVVLIVDQFEEIFTLASTKEREQFLELILGALTYASDRFKLILTIRADFISPCLEIPQLAGLIQQSSVLVSPNLTANEYRQVITAPADKVGLQVEPGLVELMLQELDRSAGDLPVLEFVLEQLWLYRQSGKLTLQAYEEEIGGIKGALERKAQAVYDSLDPQLQACAKWIFLTLTQLGEGTADTRRRVLKSDLVVKKYPAPIVEKTLEALTAAKLIVVNLEYESAIAQSRSSQDEFDLSPNPSPARGGEKLTPLFKGGRGDRESADKLLLEAMKQEVTVEIIHEILIRHWSTLRWWLEENRTHLRARRQVEQAAIQWQKNDKKSEFLLQGVRLAEAEEIYIKYADELSEEVQLFIEACLEARKQQELQAKRRLRRAQMAIAVISILGIAATGFGGFAYLQKQAAQMREIEALDSSSESLLSSHQQLEALIASVKAGKQLKNITPIGIDRGYLTSVRFKTVSTLQQSLNTTQEVNRLEGHGEKVNSVSFSPDGKLLASASDDGTLKIWSSKGVLLHSLTNNERVTWLTFSPNSKIIAAASADKTIRLWRIDGKLIQTLYGHRNWVTSISFSPDGKTIASASRDRTVKIWSLDGTLLETLTGHNGWVNNVSFSPDGKTIASASEDNNIKIWDIKGNLLQTLKGHSDSPNSDRFASRITSIAFSSDGKILISGGGDNTIKLWNIDKRTVIRSFDTEGKQVNNVSFSPDGKVIVSASEDGSLKVWSLDGKLLKNLKINQFSINSISFRRDSKVIATASNDKTVRLWNIDRTLKNGHSDSLSSISFSPDGKTFAVGGWNGKIEIWNQQGETFKQSIATLGKHSSQIKAVSFSPDGKLIASGSADRTIKIWNAVNGRLLQTLTAGENYINSLSFSPAGKILAAGNEDRSIKLWNITNGSLFKTLTAHIDSVSSVSFSPDGKLIASGSYDKTVKLWNADGTLLKTLKGHQQAIAAVAFSPDSQIVASASWDNTIKLWRVADGTLLKTLSGHNNGVTSITFSSDGQVLASGSADNTIKLWNVNDGTAIATLIGHPGKVNSISFSPDNKVLVSASEDIGITVWNLDLDNLLKQGCDRLHDYLQNNPNVTKEEKHLCDV